MEKRELTEAIEDGIYKGFWKRLYFIVIIFMVIYIVISLAPLVIDYFSEDCFETGECAMAAVDTCNYERLDCTIYDKEIVRRDGICDNKEKLTHCWNMSIELAKDSICGYGEANSWFEQYRKRVGGDLYLECD